MQINPDEITSILKSRIEGLDGGRAELTEVGTVLSVADGIARLVASGLGVEIDTKQNAPFKVKIDLDKIGGPSAGLMFTLGIMDKLEPQDLTGGKVIGNAGWEGSVVVDRIKHNKGSPGLTRRARNSRTS